MIVPNADKAIVSPEKVRDYLLSDLQPVGRLKAVFFRALGYKADLWEELEAGLRLLLAYEAEVGAVTEYGQKYVLRGRVTGPNSRSA